jgi:hypothetical protein
MLRRAYRRGQLDLAGGTEYLRDPARWHAFIDALFQADWVVYAKPAFGGASARRWARQRYPRSYPRVSDTW